MKSIARALALTAISFVAAGARAGVAEYGDEDLSNTGSYPVDPKTGATLEGLAPDVVTFGAPPVGHGYPFAPAVGDYPGTDQIFVGSAPTSGHDGYSNSSPTLGPQIIELDYSSLLVPGDGIATLTLGIAADDFQFPAYGQPFAASINGATHAALTAALNSIDQGGPVAQFFTIGIAPSLLRPDHTLTLSIDGLGDGGDGWSIDFLTVGVTTVIPEPASGAAVAVAAFALGRLRRRRTAA